jgi:hypothetical protein
MIKEIRGIIRKGRRYFQDFYNYFEIIIIGFSLAAFSMYFYRMNESNYIRKSLNQNSNDLSKTFINLQYVTTCDSLLNKFLGFCAAFATLRFIKIFRFNKRIIVFMVSFKRSLKDLFAFSVIFIPLWLSFVQVIYLLLNDKSFEYSTFSKAMSTCFQIILGKFDSETFLRSSSFLGPLMFVTYNVVIVFVMTNLFISILIDYYETTKIDPSLDEEDPQLFSFLKKTILSIFQKEKQPKPVYLSWWDTLPTRFVEFLNRYKRVTTFLFVYYKTLNKLLINIFLKQALVVSNQTKLNFT